MQRKNRLAVFEHVNHKDRSKNTGVKVTKRTKSPENTFEDNAVSLTASFIILLVTLF